jgi:hypothetical protein
MNTARLSLAIGLMALSALGATSAAHAQSVGNIGAVNPDALGAPPGGSSRKLVLGSGVVQNERVQTNAQGTAQVAFLDRSSLNIGRNSTVVIDRFVYDPSRGAGEMSASITRGALRFVGGQVSHTAGATIQTPAATIGVRGGMATIVILPGGGLRVINNHGVLTIANNAGSTVLRRAGYEVLILGPGSAPGEPHQVSQTTLAAIMQMFGSRGGQHGGASSPPTDLGSAQFGIGSPRPGATTPNFNLPGASDGVARGGARNPNSSPVMVQPRAEPPTRTYVP